MMCTVSSNGLTLTHTFEGTGEMTTTSYTIKHWDWVVLWGRYWLPADLGILIMFKRSMLVFGFEIWKWGGMLYLGPLAVGLGSVAADEEAQ